MRSRVLAIDIGNTRTAIGLVDPDTLQCLLRADVPTPQLHSDLSPAVRKLLAEANVTGSVPCAGCSVVEGLSVVADSVLGTQAVPVTWVEYQSDLPITIAYDHPSALGPDRIVNALYAYRAKPGRDVVVIDAGTAVTVDLLTAEGIFQGGAILPGINIQIRALAERTSALPLINVHSAGTHFPGQSTAECIAAGIVQGTVGAVSRLVALARKQRPECLVLTTGGAWQVLARFVEFECEYVANLTLTGTALFPKSMK